MRNCVYSCGWGCVAVRAIVCICICYECEVFVCVQSHRKCEKTIEQSIGISIFITTLPGIVLLCISFNYIGYDFSLFYI